MSPTAVVVNRMLEDLEEEVAAEPKKGLDVI